MQPSQSVVCGLAASASSLDLNRWGLSSGISVLESLKLIPLMLKFEKHQIGVRERVTWNLGLRVVIDIARDPWHIVINSSGLQSVRWWNCKIWDKRNRLLFSQYTGFIGSPCHSCRWKTEHLFYVEECIYTPQN